MELCDELNELNDLDLKTEVTLKRNVPCVCAYVPTNDIAISEQEQCEPSQVTPSELQKHVKLPSSNPFHQ